MKKKRTTEQRVKQFLYEIDWMFQLNNFDKTVTIKEHDAEEDGCNKVAKIYYESKYQRVEVEIYPIFKTYSIDKQRKVLLHELCHVIAAESKRAMMGLLSGELTPENKVTEINETEVSKIENILDMLFRGKLQYAKQAYANYLKN